MKINLTLIILFFTSFIFAQTTISGVLLNNKTKTPVPYANLGVVGESIGTVSNNKGEFSLEIPSTTVKGKFIISSIGYENEEYSSITEFIKQLNSSTIILMNEEPGVLDEVVVIAEKNTKRKKNKEEYKYAIGFNKARLGNEIGTFIKVDVLKVLDLISVNVVTNENVESFFRLSVYRVEDGLPTTKLNNQNIFISLEDNFHGNLLIDLSKFNIEVNGEFVLSFECIKGTDKLMFKARKGESLFRIVSQDAWNQNIVEIDYEIFYK